MRNAAPGGRVVCLSPVPQGGQRAFALVGVFHQQGFAVGENTNSGVNNKSRQDIL